MIGLDDGSGDADDNLMVAGKRMLQSALFFSRSGPNKWRLGSGYTPTVILENYCKYNNLPPPRYNGSNLILVNGNAYSLDEFG